MKLSIKKESPFIAIIMLPFIYLVYIWNDLPSKVPLHWNLEGEVNRYGSKEELLLIPILLPLLIYIVFLLVPSIDPKKKIEKMGNKYERLKIFVTLLMSVLALSFLYNTKNQSGPSPVYIITLIGFLLVILGNYFKTIKPNYFIGIRTPWTLKNETVWKETHKLAGKIWFIGGLTILLGRVVLDNKLAITSCLVIILLISIIPIIYSYTKFKKLVKQ